MKRFLWSSTLFGGDVAIFYGSLALALFVRHPPLFSLTYLLDHVYAFTIILPIWLLVNTLVGLFDFVVIRELPDLIGDSILAFFYNILFSVAVFYLFSNYLITPKIYLVLALGLSSLGCFAWRRVWVNALSLGFLAQRIAFIGNNPLIHGMVMDLRHHKHTRFKLISSYTLLRWHLRHNKPKSTAGASPLRRYVDLVVVAADRIEFNKDFAKTVISTAIEENIPLLIHLDFYEELYKKISPELAARPTWLFNNVLHRNTEVYFCFKRMADIFFSFFGLIVLSPLFTILTILIRMIDGSPVFYAQKRLGYLGKEFQCWKFRTMIPDAEKLGYLWSVPARDHRVTRLGRLLRRYRFDEIPQLWNILKGDISFIGPRPTWIGEKQALELPNYHLRHLVKPGLTGWAQINSRSTDSLEDTIEKVHYDLYYVKHACLSLDLAILLKTAKRIFQSESRFNRAKHRISRSAEKIMHAEPPPKISLAR